MEDEKIISKLNYVISEVSSELDDIEDNDIIADLKSILKKIIKNSEVSIKLVKEYQETKDSRYLAI